MIQFNFSRSYCVLEIRLMSQKCMQQEFSFLSNTSMNFPLQFASNFLVIYDIEIFYIYLGGWSIYMLSSVSKLLYIKYTEKCLHKFTRDTLMVLILKLGGVIQGQITCLIHRIRDVISKFYKLEVLHFCLVYDSYC